ncbi:hypothetical protein CSOJ01_10266 [Colletotrichum sojae]|uniref:Rhodopsin domain-containing protein n=1 Tax=Colletotrichum sojae TaxID=2175907 RepID=A0A8H6MQA6_9PEZI|nr:hypothetical protein CSOJ01_10266 [Colletotrichum sojae]
MSADVTFDVVTASICATLILVRCGYRIFSRCRVHDSCHRTWHADDAYMAFAIVPLVGRTSCIAVSFVLNPTHTYGPATPEVAASRGISVSMLQVDYVTSHKLLIPSRIFYALFLWSLKLCLLNFYSRFVDVFHWGKVATTALWWFIVVSFFIVLIPTLAECRPLSLVWSPDPTGQNTCHRALGNLITMGVFNIITDIALIVFPFPILRHVKLDGKVKFQLILLFSIAGLIVVITIMRMPMIITQSVSQRSRSMWASIEILCACIVANTAFFYALLKDYQRGHDTRVAGSSYARQPDYYMQAIPSSPDARRGSAPSSDRLDTPDCWRRESRSSRSSSIPMIAYFSFRANSTSTQSSKELIFPAAMSIQAIADASIFSFGAACILSAFLFVGVPFPNKRASDYYAGKSSWMSELSGGWMSPAQAGVFGAALRVAVGTAVLLPGTREAALLANGAIVTYGTFVARRDGKPMLPQWGILGAVAWCFVLGRLARCEGG